MPGRKKTTLRVVLEGKGEKGDWNATFAGKLLEVLKQSRGIDYQVVDQGSTQDAFIVNLIAPFSTALETFAAHLPVLEAEALHRTLSQAIEPRTQGGRGFKDYSLPTGPPLPDEASDVILSDASAWLESLNKAEQARKLPLALTVKPNNRASMTLAQKVFAHHAIGVSEEEGLKVGDVIRVTVDWVIASEISYVGMKKTLDQFGDYKVWRNDRFWLAGDHVVDPRNYHTDLSKKLIAASDEAAKKFKLTDYKGPNFTIIHTEFVRSRAEPGMLAIGSDSHTCSSGAVGCLAIGLGAADVAMPLVTGETWFKVPESIHVVFTGEPGPGIGGKDTILYILGELKRNTVAAERIVEFSGPGLKHLSIDARFAICNMCTEFGAITGVFVPDEITRSYINARKQKNHKSSHLYFHPDKDAKYAGTFEIDLSKVESAVAIYPNPDDVVPVSEKAGMHLDGCFIGACTTALEDLILGAMVLEAGMKKGLTIKREGKRHVVPGSLPVGDRLRELGLDQVYLDAGFTIGVPGCSFCVGMGSDQAKEGETWLTSQNRNFKNRMGKGSFGTLASAATVAASSFSMEITNPAPLLAQIDMELFDKYRKHSTKGAAESGIAYVEPALTGKPPSAKGKDTTESTNTGPQLKVSVIKSKIVTLGDYIDTDALAPAEFLVTTDSDEELGTHCLQYTHPDFREKVKKGQQVVVAGDAFGVGSSREEAVRSLQGAGVQVVIARSFAFIYGRNQPNLGLLGINITDDDFYSLATENEEIEIDIPKRVARVAGKEFSFPLTDIEMSLLANGGISDAYKRFGDEVFGKLSGRSSDEDADVELDSSRVPEGMEELQW